LPFNFSLFTFKVSGFAFLLLTFYFIAVALSPELLEILRCPKCKSKVELKPDGSALKCVNAECSLVYPVKDDIPVMIIEEATVGK
jgi:uncharacterized protein